MLLALLIIAFLAMPVVAETSGDFDYRLINGGTEAEITGYHGPGGHVEILGTIDGKPVTSIGNYSFLRTSVTSVTLPSNVTSIGDSAFYGCKFLTSVTIPNGVLSIGVQAFLYCSSLTNVTIPSSVTSVGTLAFNGCQSLTAIAVDEGNVNYASFEGVLYSKTLTTLLQCPGGRAGAFNVPHGVTSIGVGAFYYCTGLTSVNLSNTVTSIGGVAFYSCSSLISVTIGDNVTSIGDSAFYNCVSLTSPTIPDSVMTIAAHAFSRCTSMVSLTIPDGVASIGSFAFIGCTSLTAINVEAGNANYASIDGVLYNKTLTTLLQCPGGRAGAFTVPGSVKSIGGSAFSGCAGLTSVTIPNSVTSIETCAFQYCGLTSVTLADNVTSIGVGAFNYCTDLTSATIGTSVLSIGEGAFAACNNLTSITFLGLVAPSFVGSGWIDQTEAGILGHAYAASNFPASGGVWNGLTMGAVIPVVPDVPTNLTATPGDGWVTLMWSAPASDGGASITNYKVYRGTSPGEEVLLITIGGNYLAYNENDVVNGQTYYYKVSAVNSAGEGALTAEVTVTPAPAPADNTMLYIGIGAIAILAIVGSAVLLMRRRR